jgi:hypothetical protein
VIYIEVEDQKIKAIYCSSKLPIDGRDYRVVPSYFPGVVGQMIAEFDSDWALLPLEARLKAKLIPDAERYKAMDEELVAKTIEELVRDGIEQAPSGLKLDPAAPVDAPRLIPMTREELIEAGQLEAAKAHRLDLQEEEQAHLVCLASSDWYVVREAETGTVMPAEIKAQRQAARDRISAIRIEIEE